MSSIGQGSVSIDDSTLIAEKATTIADDILNRVEDLGNDNKLTPTEKIKLRQEYNKDLELYKLDVKQLQNINLPTTELDAAIGELTNFITPYFKNMDVTENVDRDQLNHVFTMFAKADKNAEQTFIDMINQVADDAKEAGEEAQKAAGQAQADATQAKADAATAQQKAQSSVDQLNEASTKFDGEITDAKKSVQQALDNITVVDSKVDKLSTSTTAQFNTLNSGYQEVISTVNNMDIGGRNIVLDSSNMGSFRIWQADGNSKLSDDKKEITITTSHGGINIEKKNLSEYLPNKGDTIVISADVKGNSHLQFNYNNGNGFVGSGTSIAVTTEYKRYFTTFEWNPVNLDKTQFVVFAAGSAGQYLTIKNVKVEIGNKGTDWSPAPEDFASQTQITTLNNLINQKVSNDQYQSDKTQTANLISQTVSSAVDGLKIGGTNLVPNSGMMQNTKGWNTNGTLITTKHAFYHNGQDPIFRLSNAKGSATVETTASTDVRFHVKRNTNYTMSVIAFATSNTVDIDVFFLGRAYGSTNGFDKGVAIVAKRKVSFNKAEYITATFNTGDLDEGYFRIDNNGTTDGKQSDVYFTEVKVEEGTKATPWSPAPEDLATSTEIDQINNAIKLKADSSDVTSQINVAIKGVQTDVTNKVSSLTTKVSQTDSAWRASVSTLGTTNMVYNGGFAHGVDGWNTNNGKWTWSNQAQDQVQGNNAIQAIFTGLTTDTWNNAASKPFLVRPGQKMSIGAIVTPWVLDSDPKKGFGLGLEFFASKDGTGTRNNYHPEQWVYTTGRQQLKVENITVPEGVNSAVVRLFIQRNGGANFTCVQANMTPTLPQFIDGFATATDITESINNINLKVANADGSSSQVNINNDSILLDANKIILNGNTSIQNGTIGTAKIANAAINDAKISSLNGNKIIAGSITSEQLNADDIIANVINGKTINGITMNTPKLNLGTNGILTEDWTLSQNTGWFQPKKGEGTTTLDMGVLRMSGNLSRWWDGNGSDQYWYGIGDNGEKIKNGSNSVTDDYAPGYEKHDIVGPSGVLLRSYLDATGLYLNQKSTKTVMAALTQQGLDTGGYIHAQQNSVVDKWFDAGVDTGTGIRIGYRAIQAHGSNDIYFNTDSTVGALTLHAKNFAASSQLSRKKDISPLEEEQAMETIMNTDIYRYHYKDETESEPYNYSVIIDDIHEKSQYKTPEEFIIADRTGRNDGNAIGFLIQALKNANRRISALEKIIDEGK